MTNQTNKPVTAESLKAPLKIWANVYNEIKPDSWDLHFTENSAVRQSLGASTHCYIHEKLIEQENKAYHQQMLSQAGEELPDKDAVSDFANKESNHFEGSAGQMCNAAENNGVIVGANWMKQLCLPIIAKYKEEIAELKKKLDYETDLRQRTGKGLEVACSKLIELAKELSQLKQENEALRADVKGFKEWCDKNAMDLDYRYETCHTTEQLLSKYQEQKQTLK